MIVLTLSDCSPALRGDLSKWLIEIHYGVYVGKVSARVRDEIWERIKKEAKKGQATLVYPAKNEQGMTFRVHNSVWEPIDFDGITLMLRPSPKRLAEASNERSTGFSKAAKMQKARKMTRRQKAIQTLPINYVALSLALDRGINDEETIHEIVAIKYHEGTNKIFHAFIEKNKRGQRDINSIITNEFEHDIEQLSLRSAIDQLFNFCGDETIVTCDIRLVYTNILTTCNSCKIPMIENRMLDIIDLSKQFMRGLPSYSFNDLLSHFELGSHDTNDLYRSTLLCSKLYEKVVSQLIDE